MEDTETSWLEFCLNGTNSNIYPECLDYLQSYQVVNKGPNILSIVFIILLMILCIIGNLLVIIAFVMFRRLRVITHYFIISLAVSDLIVGLIAMPIWLSYEFTGFTDLPEWVDDLKMIQTMEFIEIISCISSIVNLTAISIDRFFGIVMPLKRKTFVTEKTAIFFIALVWLYSVVVAAIKFVPNFTDYMIFNFVAGYALPLVIICGCYLFIFIKVKEHARRKISNQLSKQWTLAKTISIVISLLVICWTPFFVIVLMYQYCLTCTIFDQPWFENVPSIIKTLHYFNSCCNPLIYGVFNIKFRSAYKGIFYKCIGKEIKRQFDTSIYAGSRNTSVRNRSNTSVSILSYVEPTSPVSQHEADDLLCIDVDRVRTSSFTRQDSLISSKLPKPLSPKVLEDEPRLFLKQKFQRQISLEQNLRMNIEEHCDDENLLNNDDGNSLNNIENYDSDKMCYVDSFQNSSILEIDSLLSDAKESDI